MEHPYRNAMKFFAKSFYQNRFREIWEIVIIVFYGAQESTCFSNLRGIVKKVVRSWFNIQTTITERVQRILKTMFEFDLDRTAVSW